MKESKSSCLVSPFVLSTPTILYRAGTTTRTIVRISISHRIYIYHWPSCTEKSYQFRLRSLTRSGYPFTFLGGFSTLSWYLQQLDLTSKKGLQKTSIGMNSLSKTAPHSPEGDGWIVLVLSSRKMTALFNDCFRAVFTEMKNIEWL